MRLGRRTMHPFLPGEIALGAATVVIGSRSAAMRRHSRALRWLGVRLSAAVMPLLMLRVVSGLQIALGLR